jgi:hypothetical protein
MSEQTSETTPVKVLPYLSTFATWYVCLMLAVTGISFGFGINFGELGKLLIIVAAAVMTGFRFPEENERWFVGAEKWKLGLVALLVLHVANSLNTLLIAYVFLDEERRAQFFEVLASAEPQVMAFSLAIVSFFYYVATVLFLGVGVKSRLKKLGKTE